MLTFRPVLLRPALAATAALLAGLVGCGGPPETVDDATLTPPPAAKAPAAPTEAAPAPAPAPAETKPGG